jgi:hypothetical protein
MTSSMLRISSLKLKIIKQRNRRFYKTRKQCLRNKIKRFSAVITSFRRLKSKKHKNKCHLQIKYKKFNKKSRINMRSNLRRKYKLH